MNHIGNDFFLCNNYFFIAIDDCVSTDIVFTFRKRIRARDTVFGFDENREISQSNVRNNFFGFLNDNITFIDRDFDGDIDRDGSRVRIISQSCDMGGHDLGASIIFSEIGRFNIHIFDFESDTLDGGDFIIEINREWEILR